MTHDVPLTSTRTDMVVRLLYQTLRVVGWLSSSLFDGEREPHANLTPFLNVPILEIHTCNSFPGTRYLGGFSPAPTPVRID